MTYRLKVANRADKSILWEFLAIASYQESVEAAKRVPDLEKYLVGWKRRTDFGFIAVNEADQAVGAAWARQFSLKDNPLFFVDDHHPEVAMGVSQAHQGKGVGRLLLDQLITEAYSRKVGLCLNVRSTNPAVRLYERAGFIKIGDNDLINLAGGVSFGMVLEC